MSNKITVKKKLESVTITVDSMKGALELRALCTTAMRYIKGLDLKDPMFQFGEMPSPVEVRAVMELATDIDAVLECEYNNFEKWIRNYT